MRNILLTGRPGIGKTTLILKVVKTLNVDARGFYTQEIRKGNARVGFEIVEIGSDHARRGVFAHTDFNKRYKVGRYGVNISILEDIGVKTIDKGIEEKKVIIIDEIGKMELFHSEFLKILERIIDSDNIVLATISYRMTELLAKFGNRSDALIFNLENAPKDTRKRKELKEKILKSILKRL